MPAHPHPLAPLTAAEFTRARDTVVAAHGADTGLFFRSVYLEEPKKAELVPYLVAEHAGELTDDTPRPPRLARVQYDVIKSEGPNAYVQSVVDVETGEEVQREESETTFQPSFTPNEFAMFQDACVASPLFQKTMAEYSLPENFTVTIDPWPYGSPDAGEDPPRYMQGLLFARDASNKNADSNHYAYPIPFIPVMDLRTKELVRIDRLATGGGGKDGMKAPQPPAQGETPKPLFKNSLPAEYIPELLDRPLRTDMKPIDITQPEGSSFQVHADNLVEWQKWRFRLGFTPREGALIHDLCYENRPVLYRLSYSEMTVPYADPRPPFHRKQAFDLGDGGFGRAANNLQLGCDCLGAIHYFDGLLPEADGSPTVAKAVVCLHEQDNGIGWKHTNYRTGRAVVTRLRELVVQCVATLANYEYVFAYKLDVAGGLTIETRATGIVSVVAIDEDQESSPYGNIVAPGVLAQNHQHVFAVRIDPAIDSYDDGDTVVVVEESHPVKMNPDTNPYGNFYAVKRRTIDRAQWVDAEPRLNRVVRFENSKKKNAISGKNVGFKMVPPPTQLLLADDGSVAAQRAPFAKHHVWVTGHRDGELWAAGEFTNQSKSEKGGVRDMVARGDWFVDEKPVVEGEAESVGGQKSHPIVWSVFGLTHNPRIEDWPVMPVEIHHINLRPADFFTSNPALDVPGKKNEASVLVPCCAGRPSQSSGTSSAGAKTDETTESLVHVHPGRSRVQEAPATHLQGDGDIAIEGGKVEEERKKAGLARRLSSVLKWRGSLYGRGSSSGEE